MNEECELDKLRWVRLFSPIHIPTYLIEQVRDRDYSVDDFLKYQELNCLINSDKGVFLNPFNHLYAMVNEKNCVKGVLWFVIDPLSKDLIINVFSVDKTCGKIGHAVKLLSEHIKTIMKKLKINKAYWLTNYPKHSERHGFKRSKSVLMEYTGESDGKDINGRSKKGRECVDADSGAGAAIQPSIGEPGTGLPAVVSADATTTES